MAQTHYSYTHHFSLVSAIVILGITIIAALLILQGNGSTPLKPVGEKDAALAGAAYATLNAEQKQVYTNCYDESECLSLFYKGQQTRNFSAYRSCGLACLKKAEQAKSFCNDSDAEKGLFNSYFVQGNVNSLLYGGSDICEVIDGKLYLIEYACKNASPFYYQKRCPELGSYECYFGRCVEAGFCEETESSYYKKGASTIYVDSTKSSILSVKEDYCVNETTLHESWCIWANKSGLYEPYKINITILYDFSTNCGNGYACADGACIYTGIFTPVTPVCNEDTRIVYLKKQEKLSMVQPQLNKSDLAMLADGFYGNGNGWTTYSQKLLFPSGSSGYLDYFITDVGGENNLSFFIQQYDFIARYVLEFNSPVWSNTEDSTGSLSTTGTYLGDFEDTTITLLGKSYMIVQARRTMIPGGIRLLLMQDAIEDILSQGEMKTYVYDSKNYTVELAFVDATFAKFVVNGETTNKLKESEIYKLSDGTEIGVNEVLYQGIVGGVQKATFFLGKSSVELRDDNVEDETDVNPMKISNETINILSATIKGAESDGKFQINAIYIDMIANNDYYVPVGKTLSAAINATGDDPRVLFKDWDIRVNSYDGATETATIEIGGLCPFK